MGLGQANTRYQTLSSPKVKDYNGVFLFVGGGLNTTNQDQVITVSSLSDFDQLFSIKSGDNYTSTQLASDLKNAVSNGGSGWQAVVYTYDDTAKTVSEAVDDAIAKVDTPIEAVIITNEINSASELTALSTVVAKYRTANRFISYLVALPAIDADNQTFAEYKTSLDTIIGTTINLDLHLVPRLFGGEIGAFAGRLTKNQNRAIKPMKVLDGAVINPGNTPSDSSSLVLSKYDQSFLQSLQDSKLGTLQFYPNLEGVYFADLPALSADSEAIKTIEQSRVNNHISYLVQKTATYNIANNQIKRTEAGKQFAITLFRRILLDKSTNLIDSINEIYKPVDGDVQVEFVGSGSDLRLEQVIKHRPIDSPTTISTTITVGV